MSSTRNILTSVFAGTLAGVVTNYFVKKSSISSKPNKILPKSNTDKPVIESNEELHFFV